jgi:hypothetical protein
VVVFVSKFDIYSYDRPRQEWEMLIDQWIFSERDRAVLKDRLLNGLTFERLAEKHDLSVQRTKEIVYKSSLRLFKHI